MHDREARIRCYAELNDYLPPHRRATPFPYGFEGSPRVEEVVEALGIPDTAIDLILVNGQSVCFGYRLRPGDRVSVYPVFESFDVSSVARLRGEPLRRLRFVLDVHFGRLARLLRMLGFDALWRNDYADRDLLAIAGREQRILLTRDRALLNEAGLVRAYCVRSRKAVEQVAEVVARFDLVSRIRPFSRCMVCNAELARSAKAEVADRLRPGTLRDHDEFHACAGCGRVYWKGSHYRAMRTLVETLTRTANPPGAGG
ncbi:MAG: Mut7-C ubiquitin/RNAse domain-containing protein [Candidatus Lambdaproteobacteria bacterium]|nr:Mut7-C ubiquitin/RNAse domain-containing protein [Candidatus Lambdaproteobacteria bacterium]